jgi:hypothetical protein
MLKILKPLSVPKMPETPVIQFKPLKPEIKTIVADNAVDFDEKVNAELKEGWRIRDIKIPLGTYYFAILERLVEFDEEKGDSDGR